MVTIAEAMGETGEIEINGQIWRLLSLDIFDMMDLGREVGKMQGAVAAQVDIGDPQHMALVCWLVLRGSDPELSDEDRAYRRFRLTFGAARALFPATDEGAARMSAVLAASGLVGKREAPEKNAQAGQAPAPKTRTKVSKDRSSEPSTPSGSDADTTGSRLDAPG